MAESRSKLLTFMDVSGGTGSEEYALIGPGVTEMTTNYNAQTTTSQYIHEESANTTTTGYQPSAPVTAEMIKDDRVLQFVNNLRRKRATGSDAETYIVNVDVYDGTGNSHPAEKQKVSIQLDSYGGAASDPLSVGYTINWIGQGETGTFDPDTKSFSGGASGASTYGSGLEV